MDHAQNGANNSHCAANSRRDRSISVSQMSMLERCARQWYYQYELALGGQRADASDDKRLAYALKNLASIPALSGSAIHELAADIAVAIRDKVLPPDEDALVKKYVRIMGTPWRMRDDKLRYLANPTRNGMFSEHFHETPVSPQDLESRRIKAREQISRLRRSTVWDDLAACDAADIIVVESLETIDVVSAELKAKLYGKPDLAYIHRSSLTMGDGIVIEPGASGIPVIVDWKCGIIREEQAMLQLSVYAYFLREKFGILPHPEIGGYLGRVVDLSSDDDDVARVITPLDVARARTAVRRGLDSMAPLLDSAGHIIKSRAARTTDSSVCRWCVYRDLCLRMDGPIGDDAPPDAAA